jgi:hypothetical protein
MKSRVSKKIAKRVLRRSCFAIDPINPLGGLVWHLWEGGTLPRKQTVLRAASRLGRLNRLRKMELMVAFEYESNYTA